MACSCRANGIFLEELAQEKGTDHKIGNVIIKKRDKFFINKIIFLVPFFMYPFRAVCGPRLKISQ